MLYTLAIVGYVIRQRHISPLPEDVIKASFHHWWFASVQLKCFRASALLTRRSYKLQPCSVEYQLADSAWQRDWGRADGEYLRSQALQQSEANAKLFRHLWPLCRAYNRIFRRSYRRFQPWLWTLRATRRPTFFSVKQNRRLVYFFLLYSHIIPSSTTLCHLSPFRFPIVRDFVKPQGTVGSAIWKNVWVLFVMSLIKHKQIETLVENEIKA